MKERSAKGKYITSSIIILLSGYVAFATIYERFGTSYGSFYVYISTLIVALSEIMILFGLLYHQRKDRISSIVCVTISSVLFVLSNVFAEYGIIKAGAYYGRHLPHFSMILALSPSMFSFALANRLYRSEKERQSKLLLFVEFLLSIPILITSFRLISDYVWMRFVANNTNIYVALAILFSMLIFIGSAITTFSSKKTSFYIFATLAVIVSFLMNIISYDKGSIVLRIMNGEFQSWWTRLSPYYYVKGFVFASLGSYSIIYIVLLVIFWREFSLDYE